MVQRMLRTRSVKKKRVRTPGNRLVTHYEMKKPNVARCSFCKKPLHGIPRVNPSRMRKLPKSSRRPERPYGGTLCSACTRLLLRKIVRDLK
jgi:large subunit ribosomal protein L34e